MNKQPSTLRQSAAPYTQWNYHQNWARRRRSEFSKVSSSVNVLCQPTIMLTFEKLILAVQRKMEWARDHYGRDITVLIGNSGELLWDTRIKHDPRAALFYLGALKEALET